jgi:threonine/homoserine/homoserine lactone efflux protein
MSLEQLLVFIPAALLLGISPGANNLLAFVTAARLGWRAAGLAVAGRIAAWTVLVALVSLGLDTLLRTSEVAFTILKWIGVGYLLFVAWHFWTADAEAEPDPVPAHALMRREFLTLLGNPKAYLLLAAFLPQFVEPGAGLGRQLLLLGGLYIAIETAAALAWVTFGAALGAGAITLQRRRMLIRGAAGLMGLAAVLLARSDR